MFHNSTSPNHPCFVLNSADFSDFLSGFFKSRDTVFF